MLIVHTSNSMTRLAAAMAQQLALQPLDAPLQPEWVVTMGPAMARWVNLELCGYAGVVANIQYPLPANAVWDIARGVLSDLPGEDPFGREQLAWRVHALLPELAQHPAFALQRDYLADDAGGLKQWQLAERIADVFDRYQLYRPELVRQWSRGEGSDWQALLWRQVMSSAGDLAGKHRVASVDRLLHRLADAGQADIGGLPQRLSLFGVSTLPPLLVEVFNALATVIEVTLYLPSPTPHFWSDLSTRKQQAVQRLKQPDAADLWTVGNALLSSWGRQGQAFQDLLLEAGADYDASDQDPGGYELPMAGSVLGRIKRDIFELDAAEGIPPAQTFAADASLSIHICHSAMRECQVLRDHMLACMQRDPALGPEDFLVLVPQITDYAPFIEAVFGRRGLFEGGDDEQGVPFIPWNLSDIAPLEQHPLIRVFLELLALPDSRFSHSELLSWLDLPAIAERFGLDVDAVEWLREAFGVANVRWGLDAEHKRGLGLPPTAQNTWRQALDRLLAGYAFGHDAEDGDFGLFDDIAPLAGVEGSAAEALGGFAELLRQLDHYRVELARPRSPDDWGRLLLQLVDTLFAPRDEDQNKLTLIHEAIAALQQQALAALSDEALSPQLLRYWLQQRLATERRGGRYFRGGVTFCGMKPMRGLPFKQVCLLGMNDLDFPRRSERTEFDHMAGDWQHGDPRPGDEDRYLFLEALLAAQQGLSISYVGRSARDNSERQPSVLVRELLEYIDERFIDADADADAADKKDPPPFSQRLSSVHPLQAYSQRNYAELERASFDGYWRGVGEKLLSSDDATAQPDALLWPEQALPPPESHNDERLEISLDELKRFLAHPPRYFVQTRLSTWLGDDDPPPEDDEGFGLDGLQRFFIRDTLLQGRLDGRSASRELFDARGDLPHAGLGELTWGGLRADTETWLDGLQAFCDQPREPMLIDIEIDLPAVGLGLIGDQPLRCAISGQLSQFYPQHGLLNARAGRFNGAQLMGWWLDTLLLVIQREQQSSHQPMPPPQLFSSDQQLQMLDVPDADAARAALVSLLQWYRQGRQRPLLVLPKSSFALVCGANPEAGMMEAEKTWVHNDFSPVPGECDDAYIQLLTRGLDGSPLQHPDFPLLARQWYGPALQAAGWSA